LEYMHRHGIVHGDIKPGNILCFGKNNELKISDFTLTTFVSKGSEIAFGTLYWRSPECVVERDCSEKSDIWSLGVMLLDCYYQHTFFKDVATVEDGHSLFDRFCNVIGEEPSVNWLSRFIPNKTDEFIFSRKNKKKIDIGTLKEQTVVAGNSADLFDLLKRIFRWEPEDRPTAAEILCHPFFKTSAEDEKSPRLSHTKFFLRWRSPEEEKNLALEIQKVVPEGKSCPSFFLKDILVATKLVIDKLRETSTTFKTKEVITSVFKLYDFIWNNVWPDDDKDFQSRIYQIIVILKHSCFPIDIETTEQF
jgi:serine/threonine protein kinase